jgi:predicted Zn-dependent protease
MPPRPKPGGSGKQPRKPARRTRKAAAPPAKWGNVARRGARQVTDPRPGRNARAERTADDESARERHNAPVPEQWIDEGASDLRRTAGGAVRRARSPRTRPEKDRRGDTPVDVAVDPGLAKSLGPARSARVAQRLGEAARAFERQRYTDAIRILKPLAAQAPTAPSIRELHGLTLYRLGRWKLAIKELEAFRSATGSVEQHPVLADCYRAVGRHKKVQELWEELREASPSAELVAEGRIVIAGSLADRGELQAAISVLEAAPKPGRRAKPHHLRVAYALADLYERAGEVPRARELFERVAARDPDFADVDARLRALG